jgi:hypothetical protein
MMQEVLAPLEQVRQSWKQGEQIKGLVADA